MIDVCNYDENPTKEEIQILLKSLKPGQKLPLPNNLEYPELYIDQLVYENYLDRSLEGYTLKFLTNRYINKICEVTYLKTNRRLLDILDGICDVIESRDLDFNFEWNSEEGVKLHNYKPNFERGCDHDEFSKEECCNDVCMKIYINGWHAPDKCIEIGFKINGTNIECIDYT